MLRTCEIRRFEYHSVMKCLILLLVVICGFSAHAQIPLGMETNAGAIPLQKITLTGSVEIQETQSVTVARARVTPLNPNRIFEEFAVSKNDYELVLDINGSGVVELVPKSASSPLPILQVFALTGNEAILDTKLVFGDLYANLSSTALGNLFEGLVGTVTGRDFFKGTIATTTFKKFTISGVALGKNQNAVGNTVALIKFKVVTTGGFTQKP
jgi:hypothetical protein